MTNIMIEAIYNNNILIYLIAEVDSGIYFSASDAVSQLDTLRLVSKEIQIMIDQSSIWKIIGENSLIQSPIENRSELHKAVVKLRNIPKKYPLPAFMRVYSSFPSGPSTLSFLAFSALPLYQQKESFDKRNLNALWSTLKKTYQIKDVNLGLKTRAKEFKNSEISYKEKEREFIEWLDKHPEVYDVEEIKISTEQQNVGISMKAPLSLPPAIKLFKKLKLLDLRGCKNLYSLPLKLIKCKKLEIVVDQAKYQVFKRLFHKIDDTKQTMHGVAYHAPNLPRSRSNHPISYCSLPESFTLYLNYPPDPPLPQMPPLTQIPTCLELSDDEEEKENNTDPTLGKHFIDDWAEVSPIKRRKW